MTIASSKDVVGALEKARRRHRLSQAVLAETLKVSQGHYSKVIRGVVPLVGSMQVRVEAWLATHDCMVGRDDANALRIKQLAASIREQCMEIMHLSEDVLGVGEV